MFIVYALWVKNFFEFQTLKGLAILPHLLCCQGLGVCEYAGTLAVAHLRQTCQLPNIGSATY